MKKSIAVALVCAFLSANAYAGWGPAPVSKSRGKPIKPVAGKTCDCGDKLVVVDCGGECSACCKIQRREDKKKSN